jgi:hypothetical protein
VPVHFRPSPPFPHGTHFVSPSDTDAVDEEEDAVDEEEAVTVAVVDRDADCDVADDAALAPGSDVRASMPITAATIPARPTIERRLDLNISVPPRRVSS